MEECYHASAWHYYLLILLYKKVFSAINNAHYLHISLYHKRHDRQKAFHYISKNAISMGIRNFMPISLRAKNVMKIVIFPVARIRFFSAFFFFNVFSIFYECYFIVLTSCIIFFCHIFQCTFHMLLRLLFSFISLLWFPLEILYFTSHSLLTLFKRQFIFNYK